VGVFYAYFIKLILINKNYILIIIINYKTYENRNQKKNYG